MSSCKEPAQEALPKSALLLLRLSHFCVSDTTKQLHFHFTLSCIGKGNGNPLQCSCLENPRDGGAWWAAVYGVAQSRIRLKRLSSSSSSRRQQHTFKVLYVYLLCSCIMWYIHIGVNNIPQGIFPSQNFNEYL